MENEALTVKEVTDRIKKQLNDVTLKNILVEGEASNVRTSKNGHTYFTLKDDDSQIPCVLFKFNRARFKIRDFKSGEKVIVKGSIEVYEYEGKYQLQAVRIIFDGTGDKHKQVEELKNKLAKEGLFDPIHKKEIPKFPKRVGVVTAETGAAIKDIITTIKKRCPICRIILFPTLVQGERAPEEIAANIRKAQNHNLDTLIVGRGGGSFEDLMAFNEEIVARAIFDSEVPIISAVGHEIDRPISDLVADLRAPTPTAAGNFAVPDLNELKTNLNHLNEKITRNINDRITQFHNRLENVTQKQIIKNPELIYEIKGMHLDTLVNRLRLTSQNQITENRNRLIKIENSYILKNPTEITKRKSEPLKNSINQLKFTSQNILTKNKNKLFQIENSYILKNPTEITKRKRDEMQIDKKINRLEFATQNILTKNKNKLFQIENSYILKNPTEITKRKTEPLYKNINKLEVLNPLLTLKRGYSIAKTDEKVITSVKDVEKGDEVEIEFNDGSINTKVI